MGTPNVEPRDDWTHTVDLRGQDITVDGAWKIVHVSATGVRIGCTRVTAKALEEIYFRWLSMKRG